MRAIILKNIIQVKPLNKRQPIDIELLRPHHIGQQPHRPPPHLSTHMPQQPTPQNDLKTQLLIIVTLEHWRLEQHLYSTLIVGYNN